MNDLTLANQSVLQSTVDPATSEEHPYDVLVVGAGPAGSSAAYDLSEVTHTRYHMHEERIRAIEEQLAIPHTH